MFAFLILSPLFLVISRSQLVWLRTFKFPLFFVRILSVHTPFQLSLFELICLNDNSLNIITPTRKF